MTRTFCLLSKKGGVGKTTLALNCAHALAFSGYRVLLVDLDAQSNLTRHVFGKAETPRPAGPDIAQVLLRRCEAEDARYESGVAGLHLLAGSPDLDDLPLFDPRLLREPVRLKTALAPLLGEYDHVLVDCPPSLNWLTRQALFAVREVILPTQPEAYALQGLAELVPWLDKMTASAQLYRIVINLVRAQTQLHQSLIEQITAAYPGRVAHSRVRLTIDLAEAARAGVSVFESAPASAAALDLYALCFELFGLSGEGVRAKIRARENAVALTSGPVGM